MMTQIEFDIHKQPDNYTCGPTCLNAIYRYFKDEIPLEETIAQTPRIENGGTLAVLLACHALDRGYRARVYSYNVQVFDPTWFHLDREQLIEKLKLEHEQNPDRRIQSTTLAYIEFLKRGGELRFEDLSKALLRKYLDRSIPILTGLSATYLYRYPREREPSMESDDIRGTPSGHFVVLLGYDRGKREVLLADPHIPNPVSETSIYHVDIDRVICSILLGIVTHDANLLILEPPKESKRTNNAHSHRSQQPG